jgi:hypothetical protein
MKSESVTSLWERSNFDHECMLLPRQSLAEILSRVKPNGYRDVKEEKATKAAKASKYENFFDEAQYRLKRKHESDNEKSEFGAALRLEWPIRGAAKHVELIIPGPHVRDDRALGNALLERRVLH